CAAAKGWKPLPRGGGLNLPTAVEERRPASVSPSRATEETKPSGRRKMGILPVLFAILVAAGLVVLIAWQAAPWLTESSPKAPVTQTQPPAPQPASPPSPAPEETKPSAMPPPERPLGSAPEAPHKNEAKNEAKTQANNDAKT